MLVAWRLAQLLLDVPAPVVNSVVPLALIVVVLRRLAGDPFALRLSPCEFQAGRCVMNHTDSNVVLAQRYTYATVALVVGLLSFVNLFGFEKSILAVVLGLKALGKEPPRRSTPGARGRSLA